MAHFTPNTSVLRSLSRMLWTPQVLGPSLVHPVSHSSLYHPLDLVLCILAVWFGCRRAEERGLCRHWKQTQGQLCRELKGICILGRLGLRSTASGGPDLGLLKCDSMAGAQ